MSEIDMLGGEPPQDDIGISTPDAQAIKQSLLAALREGHILAGEVLALTSDLIDSFKAIDNEVIARDTMTKELTGGLTRAAK